METSMESQNATFEGWAVVELFGHTKETGFVTTRYFGGAAMFQIDIPELPERESTTTTAGYNHPEGGWLPCGSVVRKSAVPGRTRLVGPGAIYSLNPCTEEFAREVMERDSRVIKIVSMPDQKQLAVNYDAAGGISEESEEDLTAVNNF
jgi:hypothetical protein